MITITGTVGSSGKYLVTGLPVDTTANADLKMAFENNTSGSCPVCGHDCQLRIG